MLPWRPRLHACELAARSYEVARVLATRASVERSLAGCVQVTLPLLHPLTYRPCHWWCVYSTCDDVLSPRNCTMRAHRCIFSSCILLLLLLLLHRCICQQAYLCVGALHAVMVTSAHVQSWTGAEAGKPRCTMRYGLENKVKHIRMHNEMLTRDPWVVCTQKIVYFMLHVLSKAARHLQFLKKYIQFTCTGTLSRFSLGQFQQKNESHNSQMELHKRAISLWPLYGFTSKGIDVLTLDNLCFISLSSPLFFLFSSLSFPFSSLPTR